jgi:hypothetical protein
MSRKKSMTKIQGILVDSPAVAERANPSSCTGRKNRRVVGCGSMKSISGGLYAPCAALFRSSQSCFASASLAAHRSFGSAFWLMCVRLRNTFRTRPGSTVVVYH